MEFEIVREKLDVKQQKKNNDWLGALKAFAGANGSGTLIIKCKNEDERRCGLNCIRKIVKEKNLNYVVGRHGTKEIYVVKG